MNSADSVDHSSLELMRCLAVAPTIHGVLFLDLDPTLLQPIAQWLGSVVAADRGSAPRIVVLGSWQSEDDLWASVRLVDDRVEIEPGLLVENPYEPAPIVIVPNLATASLAVKRAAVSLVGASVANCERHGRATTWTPRARWLVACSREDAYRTSPHLLDRFPVRVDGISLGASLKAYESVSDLEDMGENNPMLMVGLLGTTKPLSTEGPRVTDHALTRVIELSPAAGARRDIALVKLGRAVAIRRGSATIEPEDVTIAAALLGLIAPTDFAPPPALEKEPPLVDADEGSEEASLGTAAHAWFDSQQTTDPTGRAALPELIIGSPQPLEGLALPPALTDMYPENNPDAIAEPAELRMRWPRRPKTTPARGQVIGTEPTRDLRDLAVVATLMEALKYQVIRSPQRRRQGDLVLSATDLRRNRRRPEPGTALLLVLDHTCHRDWDWSAALSPWLQWAYFERAVVSVVEFGHRDARTELRAERYRARSLLDPRIAASLRRGPGRATPLASAMDLAVDELRHLIRRGRVPVSHVLLVLMSDGRGNVPFEASVRDAVEGTVGRRGVHDALELARPIAGMREVQSIVVAPDLAPYPELPFDLADALGGVVMTVTLHSKQENRGDTPCGRSAN